MQRHSQLDYNCGVGVAQEAAADLRANEAVLGAMPHLIRMCQTLGVSMLIKTIIKGLRSDSQGSLCVVLSQHHEM